MGDHVEQPIAGGNVEENGEAVASTTAAAEEAAAGDETVAADGGVEQEAAGATGADGPASISCIGPPSPLTGCYLLIIIGEPHSAEHKDIILQRLIKGGCWLKLFEKNIS